MLILVENLSVPMDRRVWQEATSLTRGGYDVSVICPRGAGRDAGAYDEIDGIKIYRYPLRPASGGLLGYLREYGFALWHTRRLVRRLARRRPFDIVQACNPPDFLLLAALSQRRHGAAFIFDHHDLVPELYLSRFGRGEDLGYKVMRFVEKLTFRLADVVISTNESYRRVAVERGGFDPDAAFVVRSAPDLERFHRVDPVPELRRGKRHLLAYLGVMGPQDGVDHALRALADLRSRRDDWHAIFVGAGDVFDQMRALAARLDLGDVVEFTGRIPNEQLLEILSTADVGLAPDPKNPLNDVSTMNKVVEYMAVGLPVVSYDLVEARVSAGDAAAYATANDAGEFAAAIEALLDDPGRRRQMAAVGRRRVEDRLSWRASEVRLLQAYFRAVSTRDALRPPHRAMADVAETGSA